MLSLQHPVPAAVYTSASLTSATHGSQLLSNFVSNKIEADLARGANGGRVVTRFPPEPNGYLHLGHAKSINLNFGLASAYGGVTHMRLDDTNPAAENVEYINSILHDVRWLVEESTTDIAASSSADRVPWSGHVRYASDYFPQLYAAAEWLIMRGAAYVDDLSAEQVREYRGTLTTPGKNSPFRTRSVEENLSLFREMRAGLRDEGDCVLRAKIDMSSGNMNLRDPTLYRIIKRHSHPMTGTEWCIYPMYDFAHALSDALEDVTHSLCTLEFEDHRPLYDWCLDNMQGSGILPNMDARNWRPTQTEFSRLNLQYTVLSKRKLIQLVTEKHVQGWDDPRMPTISGLRRRGVPSAAIRMFCDRIGISKAANNIDMTVLEDCVREVLDHTAPRALAVLQPLRVTITNYPTGQEETFTAEKHPKRAQLGTRDIPFTGEVYIDREDFFDTGPDGSAAPPKGFKRLTPGGTVRLKYAYVIRCDSVVRDAAGVVSELMCSYDVLTRAGQNPAGAMPAKGIIQWVSQRHAVPAEVILYDRLFKSASPGMNEDGDFLKDLNPGSIIRHAGAVVERSAGAAAQGDTFQFERMGYFCRDPDRAAAAGAGTGAGAGEGCIKFNRVVTLRDTWAAQTRTRAHGASESPQEIALQGALPSPGYKPPQHERASVSKSSKGGNALSQPAAAPVVEDVLRVDLRVGLVLSAEKHPEADNLYIEKIDCGDATGPRTVISGLARFIPLDSMTGRLVVVICNLKPAKMRGIISEGMLLAAAAGADDNQTVELVSPPTGAVVGEAIRVEGFGAPQPDAQLKSKSAQEVWKRVAAQLVTDGERRATFGENGNALMTSAGPCRVPSLVGANIS